jgi:RNA polymerase sigma factor (sigma-70 family)
MQASESEDEVRQAPQRADRVKELFEHNTHFTFTIIREVLRGRHPGEEKLDDIRQAALIGLWKAALAYDETRGFSFTTFAGHYIRGEIWRLFLKRKRVAPVTYSSASVEVHEPVDPSPSPLEVMAGQEDTGLDGYLSRITDPAARQMVELRLAGKHNREIAPHFGVSHETVRQRVLAAAREMGLRDPSEPTRNARPHERTGQVQARVLDLLRAERRMTVRQLIERGLPKTSVKDALQRLEAQGEVRRTKGEKTATGHTVDVWERV